LSLPEIPHQNQPQISGYFIATRDGLSWNTMKIITLKKKKISNKQGKKGKQNSSCCNFFSV